MKLQEAFESCENGNFVTHRGFDKDQSMHYYKGKFYYEDGACLTHHIDWMESNELFKEGWSVKYTTDQVDKNKLDKLHRIWKGPMLGVSSYENCIVKESELNDD